MTQNIDISSSKGTISEMLLPTNELVHDVDVRFGYRIGAQHFVLDISLLTELVIKPKIFHIPKSPPWLNGVINLRGTIVPVADISQSLNATYSNNPGDYVLVIDKGEDALALLVDAPPKSLRTPKAQTSYDTLHSVSPEFVSAGVQSENISWVQLDVKGLVLSLRSGT